MASINSVTPNGLTTSSASESRNASPSAYDSQPPSAPSPGYRPHEGESLGARPSHRRRHPTHPRRRSRRTRRRWDAMDSARLGDRSQTRSTTQTVRLTPMILGAFWRQTPTTRACLFLSELREPQPGAVTTGVRMHPSCDQRQTRRPPPSAHAGSPSSRY
jgi:hypothetical protein